MRNKYRNKKTKIDGVTFSSKKEAGRYAELKLLERGNKIKHLQIQPEYTLQDAFKDKEGVRHRAIKYVSDFEFYDVESNQMVVEDVKASKNFQTEAYKIKKKLFIKKYPNFVFKEVY